MQIRSLGFNTPQVQLPETLNVSADSAPSTAPIETLNQGQQILNQSIQQAQSTSQRMAQSTEQRLSIEENNRRSIAETSINVARASGNSAAEFQQSLQGLGTQVQNLLDYQLRKDQLDAQRKAELEKQIAEQRRLEQEARKVQAVNALERIQKESIERGSIEQLGTDRYFKDVSDTIAGFDLSPDDTIALTQKYTAPALDYAKNLASNRIEEAKKLQLTQREINKATLVAPLSASLAKLALSDGASPDTVAANWQEIQTSVGGIMSDERFPLLDRAETVATVLEQAVKGLGTSNAAYIQAQQAAEKFRNLAAYAAQEQALLVSGARDYQTYHDNIKAKSIELGVEGYTVPDPDASTKQLASAKQARETIRSLSEKQALSDLENISADNAIIGGLATNAVLSPAFLAEIRRSASSGADVNAKQAVEIVDKFLKWRETDVPEYATRRQKLANDARAVADDFNMWFVNNTKPNVQSTLPPALSKQLEILRGAGITTEAVQQQRVTPEQIALIQASKQELINGINSQIVVLDQNYNNAAQQFANVGLFLDVNQVKSSRQQFQQSVDLYNQRRAEIEKASTQAYPEGMQSAFKYGTSARAPLSRRQYAGKVVVVPFIPQDATSIPEAFGGQLFGAPRGDTRRHDGLDFAVPNGTKLLSLVPGVIRYVEPDNGKKGYGLNIEVQGDDGFNYHYAHLSGTKVVAGQRIEAGEIIALSGETGSPGSQHLHLGVYRRNKEGQFLQALDPLTHLATHQFDRSFAKPRTAGTTQSVIPKGALPLGNNQFILNGKVQKIAPGTGGASAAQAASPRYTASAPVRNSYMSRNAADYKTQRLRPDEPHGYAKLAKDQALAREINRVANKYNMPGVWLADIIAYETAGSFSASIENPWGYTGLIQFGDAVMQDLGVTRSQLKAMSPAQQMKWVDAYLGLRLKQSGVKAYKGPEWLIAAINQGNVALQQVDKYGAKAVLDPRNADGAGVTLEFYLNNLGKYSGRQYDFLGSRRKRVSQVIHDRPRHNCTTCIAMAQPNVGFLPHESSSVG